ncbi:hypothetical protein [Mesorhizobium sp.]|uniref:hypothetical protein n=1 Tax=Mesorhizobium sp. TaxID=1871066 RepID=UPI0025B82171|nr:hypothetical protein [Mesorhizobium sp.]
MRWPLFVVALIVGFFFWDHFANDGAYMADLKRFRDMSWDTSGDWKPPTITFNWDLPKR